MSTTATTTASPSTEDEPGPYIVQVHRADGSRHYRGAPAGDALGRSWSDMERERDAWNATRGHFAEVVRVDRWADDIAAHAEAVRLSGRYYPRDLDADIGAEWARGPLGREPRD